MKEKHCMAYKRYTMISKFEFNVPLEYEAFVTPCSWLMAKSLRSARSQCVLG